MVNSLSSKHKEGEMSQCVADGAMYKSGNNYYPICKNKIRNRIIGLNLFKYSKRSKMHSLHIWPELNLIAAISKTLLSLTYEM
jgi:hypothetical protein